MSELPSNTISWVSILLFALSACVSSQTDSKSAPVRTPLLQVYTPSITSEPDLIQPELTQSLSTPTLLLPSLTPIPTVPVEEAYNLLASWLQNEYGCQLPCWGGLIPGTSPSEEAYSNLTALRNIADVGVLYPTGGNAFITYPLDDLSVEINVGLHSKADGATLQVIWISTYMLRKIPGGYEEVYDAPAYNNLLEDYTLSSILSKYGYPNEVLVRADIYTTGTQETFSITLTYPDKGIFVRYNMLAERKDDRVYGCPSRSFVELWLLSPMDANIYQEILLSNDLHWERSWPYTTPIEESVSMTIESFYQTYQKPSDYCLETPLKIWPDH